MEKLIIIGIILFCFIMAFLLKVTTKYNYNKGREDMLNQIYGDGALSNDNYKKYRSTLKP